MKRSIKYFATLLIFIFSGSQSSFAQDDSYYDPSKDPANQSTNQSSGNNNSSSQQESIDKTDGYGNPSDNPAYKYDSPSNSEAYQQDGNTYITNNYYDEDYGYTTRLRRYYTPNFGVNYYSYWFTPSFCLGWGSWNNAYVVSYNPWYSDPWWDWNRRNRVVVYDPFFDPYWSWNFGWNSCSYYNSWSNPYGGYGCGNNNWGNNNWGYGGGGYCGGNGGYYNGYNNGYWNGYNNGYYNGYNDGYWNTAYGGGGYYNGGRRSGGSDNPTNPPVTPPLNPVTGFNRELPKTYQQVKPNVSVKDVEIPREGIQKPFTPTNDIKKNDKGLQLKPNTIEPYHPSNPNVVIGKGVEKNTVKPNTDINGSIRPVKPNVTENNNSTGGKYAEPKNYNQKPEQQQHPDIKQSNNNWTETPPSQWDAPRNNRERNVESKQNDLRRYEEQQRTQQNNDDWQRPQKNVDPKQFEPRPEIRQERRVEQPRNVEPRNINPQPKEQQMQRMEQPRNFNTQPQPQRMEQRMEQPRNNFREAPQQGGKSGSMGRGNNMRGR